MGLESLQRCLANCYLRESIPQHDRSGEETLMVAGERCWNLHKACVMASGSVVKWSQVPFSGDVYLLVSNAVHHRQAGLVSALLQGIPTKVLTHGGDTTRMVNRISFNSHLTLLDIAVSVRNCV